MRLACGILVQEGQPHCAARLVSRAADELAGRGFGAEADELTNYAERLREDAGLSPSDWHDPATAECAYCGAVIRANKPPRAAA